MLQSDCWTWMPMSCGGFNRSQSDAIERAGKNRVVDDRQLIGKNFAGRRKPP